MTALSLMLTGLLAVSLLMLALWVVHLRTRNAGIVDAGWAGGLALLGIYYSVSGKGYPLRSILIAAMSGIWGFRLAYYLLATRVIGQPEEGRYLELRRSWATRVPLKFLMFFEFQALLCSLLSTPFLAAAVNSREGLYTAEWIGFGVWLLSVAGESLADRQLHAFKSNPANRGKTCDTGLWRYSRHPNYFFEWAIWLAFAIFALPSPYGYLGIISPVLILYFLLRVTGIPATEAQALRTKGEEYRRYQETTSAFIPWFPRGQNAK